MGAPHSIRMIDLGGGLRARFQPGPGEVIFWVHGYTIDSSLWTSLWSKLPAWSHVGVDLPGHGKSSPPPAAQTLVSLGQELASAALSLNARHIVGLSLGSMIALQLVLSQPKTFATLCLGAPALAGGPREDSVGRRYGELAQLMSLAGAGPWMRELWMQSPPDLFTYAVRNPALRDRLIATIDRHSWQEFTGPGITRLATEKQPLASLGAIESRVLVLIGEHEFPAFRLTAQILEGAIPSCAVVELPDAGHLCMLEAEDESARVIATHLQSS